MKMTEEKTCYNCGNKNCHIFYYAVKQDVAEHHETYEYTDFDCVNHDKWEELRGKQMTKDELRKEATFTIEWESTSMIDRPLFVHAYITGALPREKRIEELEAQIEKMKCCLKCEHWYYYKSFCDKDNSYHSEGQSCEHFTLRR